MQVRCVRLRPCSPPAWGELRVSPSAWAMQFVVACRCRGATGDRHVEPSNQVQNSPKFAKFANFAAKKDHQKAPDKRAWHTQECCSIHTNILQGPNSDGGCRSMTRGLRTAVNPRDERQRYRWRSQGIEQVSSRHPWGVLRGVSVTCGALIVHLHSSPFTRETHRWAVMVPTPSELFAGFC